MMSLADGLGDQRPANEACGAPPAPLLDAARLQQLGFAASEVGILIVDHGSRRAESNDLLLEVVEAFRRATGLPIVEPAHMELAEPSIAAAFTRCQAQGAKLIVVHPYFLSPGRHWRSDIPRLAAQAAAELGGVRFLVTAPLGLHQLMPVIMQDRIRHCLQRAQAHDASANPPSLPPQHDRCDVCQHESTGCQFLP